MTRQTVHQKSFSRKSGFRLQFLKQSNQCYTSSHLVPTSNLVCIERASILNSQSHGGTVSSHCEVIILSIEFLARSKDQVKSLVFINDIDFHRLFEDIYRVVFSHFVLESYTVNRRLFRQRR